MTALKMLRRQLAPLMEFRQSCGACGGRWLVITASTEPPAGRCPFCGRRVPPERRAGRGT